MLLFLISFCGSPFSLSSRTLKPVYGPHSASERHSRQQDAPFLGTAKTADAPPRALVFRNSFRVSEMPNFSPAHIRVNKFTPAAGQARVIVCTNSPAGQQVVPILPRAYRVHKFPAHPPRARVRVAKLTVSLCSFFARCSFFMLHFVALF